jgi:hypothetical protein
MIQASIQGNIERSTNVGQPETQSTDLSEQYETTIMSYRTCCQLVLPMTPQCLVPVKKLFPHAAALAQNSTGQKCQP